jgi:preprotein translocase subunit SecB
MIKEENMADNENEENAAAAVPEQALQAQVGILAQYVKDLSFENPNAPASLQKLAEAKPSIDVSVNVNARQVGEDVYEIDLKITAGAKHEEETAFIVELLYSGLFGAKNLPAEALQPFLLIECPRLLFPFARRVVSDATRDGGFPPLLLEPIDFAGLYVQHLEQQKKETEAATVN